MLKSAILYILFIFVSLLKFSSSYDWVIDGDVECKENIHGLGEFSFLLQEAIVNFYERDQGQKPFLGYDPDDHLDGPVLTDSMGHFKVKGRDYEMTGGLEYYLQIDHQCYTPTSEKALRMGCYYRTIIELDEKPYIQKVHITLGMESARLITGKRKDLEIKTIDVYCLNN